MLAHFEALLSLFFIIYLIISIIIIILDRRRPEKTIAWLLILIFFPPVGMLFYFLLGLNWKVHKLNDGISPYVKDLIHRVISRIDNPDYIPLINLLGRTSDSPLFIDNDITIFRDGEEKFNALIKELEKAKNHIHLEYYIVKSDDIGNKIKDILIKKAKRGVKVRFVMDRVGCIKLKRKYIKELKDAGVDVVQYSYFLAPVLRQINTSINFRNHRKIAVIDGKVGFVGGMNIGDEYLGRGKLGFWRDTHIMIKGDFVLGLQAVFLDDYYAIKKSKDKEFNFEENFDNYFPDIPKSRGKIMQLVTSGPDSEYPSIMHGVLKMISMAKESIYIETPYFVPPEGVMDALKVAALSGIKVKILFPGQFDHFFVYYASRSYLAELLKCGAEVYFFKKKCFMHSKVMVVDGKITTLGTANMDIRSYNLNYEINTVIYDEEISKRLLGYIIEDLKISSFLTWEKYQNSPKIVKITEAFARLFSTIL